MSGNPGNAAPLLVPDRKLVRADGEAVDKHPIQELMEHLAAAQNTISSSVQMLMALVEKQMLCQAALVAVMEQLRGQPKDIQQMVRTARELVDAQVAIMQADMAAQTLNPRAAGRKADDAA